MEKTKLTRIILGVVALVLVGAIIAANVVVSTFAPMLNRVFLGNRTDYSGATAELEEGDEVVQQLAEESMVLLKNDDGFLPLEKNKKLNLFGWAATDQGFILVGGGSGTTVIAEQSKVTFTDALDREKVEYNKTLLEKYSALSNVDADNPATRPPDSLVALTNPDASFYTADTMNQAKEYSDVAVVVLSRYSGENASDQELISVGDYNDGAYLELTANEKAMLDALQANNFNVIVLFNTTNNMEMGFLEEYSCIKAAINVGVPGQSGTLAIPRILYGDVNPSGRLADTLAYDYQTNNPTYINNRYINDTMAYQEGIYVGYKWYETADAEGFFNSVDNKYGKGYEGVVQYPFGYGLSYTNFEWEVKSCNWNKNDVIDAETTYEAVITVHNTGEVAGRDVVELYFTPQYIEGGIEKASVNLLTFAKTDIIQPGESYDVTLSFTAYDLAAYDDYDKNKNNFKGYEVESGEYQIKLMRNAHDEADFVEGETGLEAMTSDGLQYSVDPVTGEAVVNRFTGDTAYAGVPIDGSTVIDGIEHLSRANNFSNYPTQRAGDPAGDLNSDYIYDGYDDEDTSNIQYGVDSGMYLVQVGTKGTDEEGNEIITDLRKATVAELSGGELGENEVLTINEELMKKLSDYDATEWDAFLNQLTQEEIQTLIGFGGYQTREIESIGKPYCDELDGPAGFNQAVINPNDTNSEWTAYPIESLIGCSWNTDLVYAMGVVQGKIGTKTNVKGWYAPGVNLHRSVYNTRNFEYFSEDAILTGELAANMVAGAKSENLYCYVKHLAISEAGANPYDTNTWITEQALREVYLKPFEMCVKEGGATAMMSAFNRVGSVWAGSNHALLNDILRTEWGFRGSVITDFYQADYMDYESGLKAGNTLWLCPWATATIDFNDNGSEYAARKACKDIIYNYIVTTTYVGVTAVETSPIFITLWVLANVVLVAGLGVTSFFLVRSFVKKNRD